MQVKFFKKLFDIYCIQCSISIMYNFINEFYNTLPNGSILVGLLFDSKNESNNLYAIDSNYKIIKNNIDDPINGYAIDYDTILGISNIENYDEEGKIKMIESSYENKNIYGIPISKIDTNKKINKALFLDRDGILIEDTGYVSKVSDVVVSEEFIEVVKYAKSREYLVIVITNQSGIARGYFTYDEVRLIHKHIDEWYKKFDAKLDDYFISPYHPKGVVSKYSKESLYRKPCPAMILDAAKKYNIDITKSLMIGDRDTDLIKLPYLKSHLTETTRYDIKSKNSIIDIKEIYNLLD